jgi:hypothetical protein
LHNFCTLFDSVYLSRGLAMHESLNNQISDFHLYIFAFDALTNEILVNLNLNKATVISLEEFETADLKKIKKQRSKAEYCWTCTPSVISYVLEKFCVPQCTYVDSDLIFYSDPSVLISELDRHNKNVLITEHRFSFFPRLYEEKRGGRFCVQFMTFRNEVTSLKVLDKWRNQCINWCYARYEDGKFGDQKYLDEWPRIYENIHILEHQGGGIAPWNINKYRFKKDGTSVSGIIKKNRTEFEVVFFHFQYVKFLENGSFDIGWYFIPSMVKFLFYVPYLLKIEEIERKLLKLNKNYNTGFTDFKVNNIKNFLKTRIKKYFGYNILKIQQ